MTLLEAARQALEALCDERYVYRYTQIEEAITNLRTAISEAEKCEPVAWRAWRSDIQQWSYKSHPVEGMRCEPLYTLKERP